MGNSRKYKLYKNGKFLVAGVVVATGMATTTAISHVNADTVSGDTAQAVQVTSATQSPDMVQLPASSQANDAVAPADQTNQANQANKVATPEVKSDVPTSVDNTTTQDQAKTTIDNAQNTVKSNVETAKQAGVVVTEGETQQVTLNNGNAVSKTNEILSDLNKQDLAVQQATATQKANQEAYDTSQTNYDETVKQGQADLEKATNALDNQVEATKQAGIEVSVATSKLSPEYKDLSGLTGQGLLDAMAYNIDLYQKAVASGVKTENTDQAKLEAMVKEFKQKQADFAKATADRANTIKQGQNTLAQASRDLDMQIEATKQAGIEVSVATSKLSPAYKQLAGLTGQDLLDAMAYNIDLYQKAVASGVKTENADQAKLVALVNEFKQAQASFVSAKNARDLAVSQGQSDLVHANANIDNQVDKAQKLGLTVDMKTSQVNPNYQSVKGLTGQALTDAVQANINAYQNAVKQAVDQENGTAQSLQGQIDAYQKVLSDYQAGLSVSTGLKWGHGTYVTGDNKMAGNEAVTSFADPSIKAAAMYAIQGNNLDQNTDANFDNIFKINGSGSVTVHDTSNGDVTITFSNIVAPANTGTYVAVWGAEDGGIAFGVFATYNGRAVSGAGESGGGTAGLAGGNILDYVYSYDAEVTATGNVSVATFNDIDNNQTVTTNGLGGQVTLGQNITQDGNNFTAHGGDVSQGSSGNLDTNSVRWSLGKTGPLTFSFHHMTADRTNTSIVGGIFGADSDIPQEPQKPNLSAEKVSVAVPDSPEAPVAPKANATKVTVDVLPAPVAPVAPKANVTKVTVDVLPAPEAPAPQEVAVHYYDVATTPETPAVPQTPQMPTPSVPAPVVEKAGVLPHTGAEENTNSSVLGALASVVGLGLLGSVARKFKKQ